MRQVEIRLTDEPGGRRKTRYPFTDAGAIGTDSITAAATGAAAFVAILSAAESITPAATATAAFSATADVAESLTAAAEGAAVFVGHAVLTGTVTAAADAAAAFVAGGYRQITLPPSEPPPQSAAPTVVGGGESMQLYIGGVNLSEFHKEESASIQSQTIGRWTANIELFDDSDTILDLFSGANGGVGLSIIIQEFGYKLFAGCIQSVVAQRYLSTANAFTFQITATDKSGICDRRVVKKALYPADSDGADVIRHIVTNYLDGEGITAVNVPATLGELITELPLNFQTVRSAFDEIATRTATVWWVDINGDLHFSALLDLPAAPFSLSETSQNWRGVSDSLGLQVTTTLQDYRNKQYVVTNRNIRPEGAGGPQITEAYNLGPNGQQQAFDAGFPFGYILLNFPISAVISVKVNGVSKNHYDINEPSSPPYGSGANDWYFYRLEQLVFPSNSGTLVNGDLIEIIYVSTTTNVVSGEGEALVPVDPTLGQCGSGLYEAVEQVQDIEFSEDLTALAESILTKAGGVPTTIEFEVIRHGLQPGQLLPVNIPLIGLTARQFLITAVAGHSVGATLGQSCSFRWMVTARSNQDPGNWVKWFERVIRRTEQPKPVVQLETHAFIIQSGANIIGATPIENPVPIERPGKLYAMRIAAGFPPEDQDLQITFSINGIPVGEIVLASTDPANEFIIELFDTAVPYYVDTNQALTATALYINIGSNPVAARHVTATISHAI